MTSRNFVALLNRFISAIASAFPKRVSTAIAANELQYRKPIMFLTRNIAYHGLILAGFTLLSTLKTGASEISRSITFTDGSRLTAAQLHTLIDGAVINTTFLTGQTLESTLAGDDYFLVYSSTLTGWRKITATAALYQNTALITSASEKTAPTTADYLLLYDAASTSLKKLSIGTLASNITYTLTFTNLATHTTPTNQDKLLIFSSEFGSNRLITLAGMITNLPVLGWGTNAAGTSFQMTNTDTFAVFSTLVQSNGAASKSNIVSQVTLGQLSNALVVPFAYESGTFTVPNSASIITNTHSLNSLPVSLRVVLVCTNAEWGYSIGDEVSWDSVFVSGPLTTTETISCDTNKFYFACAGANTYAFLTKTNGAAQAITKANWRLKFRALFTR